MPRTHYTAEIKNNQTPIIKRKIEELTAIECDSICLESKKPNCLLLNPNNDRLIVVYPDNIKTFFFLFNFCTKFYSTS